MGSGFGLMAVLSTSISYANPCFFSFPRFRVSRMRRAANDPEVQLVEQESKRHKADSALDAVKFVGLARMQDSSNFLSLTHTL